MKNYTIEELEIMLKNIENGTIYYGFVKNQLVGKINISPDKQFIRCENCSSSSFKNNVDGLKSAIKIFFNDCEKIVSLDDLLKSDKIVTLPKNYNIKL